SAAVLPSFPAPTCPAMNRNSDAFTRVICEYCPSGLPRLSGFRYWTCGMGGSGAVDGACAVCAGHPRSFAAWTTGVACNIVAGSPCLTLKEILDELACSHPAQGRPCD